jgi:hypothetical protein
MNRMRIPGFTAEASLCKIGKPYGTAIRFKFSEVITNLYPQRVSSPIGPIGLPGQDCGGACLHTCMLSGRVTQECMETCLSTCSGSPVIARYELTTI